MWWIIGVGYIALTAFLLWFLYRAGRLSARSAAGSGDPLVSSVARERSLRH